MGERLKDRVAIVTGGGKGIGKAISLAFAKEGAIVAPASRTLEKLEETVDEIRRMGGRGMAIRADIRDEAQVEQMVARVVKEFGRVDILVNNSGLGGPTVRVVDLDMKDWNDVIALDLTGAVQCCKHVLRYMIPQKSGSIINIAAEGGRSGDGRSGYPMRSPYCCSKMGMIGLTETLSIEVGEYGIRVNAISPAAVRGERILSVVKGRAEAAGVPFDEVMGKVVANYSLRRMTEESEVGTLAVLLASEETSPVTGQTIVAHCGLHVVF